MKHFTNCTTIDQVKATYKMLCKLHHPDLGGDTAIMQEINTEYAFVTAKILKGGGMTNEEVNDNIRMSEEYRKVIEKIITLPNIVIALVGNWIWVTGNTFSVKDTLKSAGMFFASKKLAWYYRSAEFSCKSNRSGKDLDEIKAKYGSEKIGYKSQFAAIA